MFKLFLPLTFSVCSDEPVDGAWSEWQTGTCTLTCGGGLQDKTRTCSNPAQANWGADCTGASTQQIPCNQDPCPGRGKLLPTNISVFLVKTWFLCLDILVLGGLVFIEKTSYVVNYEIIIK